MKRLSLYLFGLLTREAAGIFALSVSIMFLVQCLRVSDLGGFAGGSLLTGLLAALFGLGEIAVVFLTVATAIGLGRVLRTLTQSRELHIIHASGQIGTLFGTVTGWLVLSAVLVLALAHEGAPRAVGAAAALRAEAAADLVNRSLKANAFAELSPGVTVSVSGRSAGGEITGFFADDRRGDPRRTYIARSALLAEDAEGYVLRLNEGRVQYLFADGRFSEMAFEHYDMGLDRLTEGLRGTEAQRGTPTSRILADLASGTPPDDRQLARAADRTADGLRVLVLGLLVLGLGGFPDGRRRPPRLPIEVVVLVLALLERAAPALLPGPKSLAAFAGVAVLGAVALGLLAVRFRPRFLAGRRAL